jgi:DNA-binding MarR family transcriptional regulator
MPRADGFREHTEVDRVIHDPVRFAIMACLALLESADFLFLLEELSLTKGNLAQHINKLEESGYVTIEKVIREKRTHTMYQLTPAGHEAFDGYRRSMRRVLEKIDRR